MPLRKPFLINNTKTIVMLHPDKFQNEIYTLLTKIEEEYPELSPFLDENLVTIPYIEHPKLDDETFSRYLDDLKQLLYHYRNNHQKNKA